MPYFPFPGRSPPFTEDFELDIFGISQLETVESKTPHMFTSKTEKACLIDLCRASCFTNEAQEMSGTSAPEGE